MRDAWYTLLDHLRHRWWIYAAIAYIFLGSIYMGGHRSLGRGGYP